MTASFLSSEERRENKDRYSACPSVSPVRLRSGSKKSVIEMPKPWQSFISVGKVGIFSLFSMVLRVE